MSQKNKKNIMLEGTLYLGWEGNIMAESAGKGIVTNKNIKCLLNPLFHKYKHGETEFYRNAKNREKEAPLIIIPRNGTQKMKILFFIVFIFLACGCKEKTAKKWMKEAYCTDSINIVSPDKIANIKELKLRGLTLQQVESLYGHYHEVAFENRQIKSPMDLQKIPDSEFASLFTNEDYPMYISAYFWFRDPTTKYLFKHTENTQMWKLAKRVGDLGLCMEVYFIKYDNKLIVFDAYQGDCWGMFFAE